MRVPSSVRSAFEEICELTDGFCRERLDSEYAELCRKLVAKLARRRPSPLERGDPRIWAAGTLYAVGRVNFIFDRSQKLHLSADELSALTGVRKSRMASKARLIIDTLGLSPFDREFSRREVLDHDPFVWLVEVNGMIVDVRSMPAEIQEEARRRGLVPDPRAETDTCEAA